MKSVAGIYGGNVDNLAGQVEAQERAAVIVIDLRANGTAEAKIIGFRVDQAGVVVPVNRIAEGDWKVERDCTGALDVEFQESKSDPHFSLELALVAVENASEIFAVGGTFLEEVDFMRIFSSSNENNDDIDDN